MRFVRLLLLSTAAACLLSPILVAQSAAPATSSPAGDEATEVARLQALPPSRIPLKNATLSSAIRLLAEDANMSFLAPADKQFEQRITSDVTMNPYDLLQFLGANYGFGMKYEYHIWKFYRVNRSELVTRAYTIRFNNLQQVQIGSSSISSQLASFSGSGGMGGSMGGGMGAGMGGMSGGGMGGAGYGGLGGAGGNSAMNARTNKIIDDIKKILAIPTEGLDPALPNGGATVEKPTSIDPIWNPDTSQLFVVATEKQQELVAQYLKTVDQPQKLIRIAVKFVETTRNPTQSLGVDWSNTLLGSGGPITLAGQLSTSNTNSSTGNLTSTTSNNLSAISSVVKLGHIGHLMLPAALLSAPAFQWTMNAIASDQNSSVVQDPVLFTANNRQVTFKATTEEPIQQGSTTFGSATAATSSQIAYIEIGTSISVLPTLLPGAVSVHKPIVVLSLSINVSSISGFQTIGGNPYPVTSERTYSYSVPIPTGETLAIAGLEQRSRNVTASKLPIFGDAPIIGYLFKNKQDQIIHTNLMAFITPEVVDEDVGPGPEPTVSLPPYRHVVFLGTGHETLGEVDRSLNGLSADITALEAAATPENRDAVINRMDQINIELSLMDVRLGELKMNSDKLTARQTKLVDKDREQLLAARARVSAISVAVASQ